MAQMAMVKSAPNSEAASLPAAQEEHEAEREPRERRDGAQDLDDRIKGLREALGEAEEEADRRADDEGERVALARRARGSTT
jgi:hypothetical protein